MPWEIRIEPVEKGRLRAQLDGADIEAQTLGMPETARDAMRAQLSLAKAAAGIAADLLPGPKVAGVLRGHSNGAINSAMPPGADGERISIEVYQVRFLNDA